MKKILLVIALGLFTYFSTSAQCNSHAKRAHYTHHRTSSIVQTAQSVDALSTLVVAVKAAQLQDVLSGDGPFTVFAPTNTAFAKLPDGTVNKLLKPENKDDLQKVLTYHVVAGQFTAKDIVAAIQASGGKFEVETVAGDKLTASLQGSTVLLTDQQGRKVAVSQTDVQASNGIVHVIDGVVLP